MPSTYSPNLRIELIATGEQSGTWGVTTNTNLGTLIEDAIAGYVSVSITSANQALTASNGTADQSRNMVINLTTTTTANFNVYIPPADKVYIIRNSSAYNATIFCSTVLGNTTAAGTGTTIPAGRETIVFSDGTNVNFGLDYASTLALGTALPATSGGTGQSSYAVGDLLFASTTTALSKLADVATGNALISGGVGVAPSYGKIGLTTHVSGTLPVANGGTGITSFGTGVATWLGTPSSANLAAAVTDETGSGALVFANSPTLVTPALGTPASGVVTNLTGTASININGTVGATTANTGAFTTLSASGDVNFTGTGAVQLPAGTTAQRPTPVTADLRYNTSFGRPEVYNGSAWVGLGGATGGGGDNVFYENSQTVTTNYTITSGDSAMSTGPITINASVTVTVPTGSRWVVL
jgi:hypothetical protein